MEEDVRVVLDHTADRLTAVERQMHKIHQTLVWIQVLSVLRIMLIAIPIILAIIYLPAFLADFRGQLDSFRPLFGL
ncbi:MAG: hypothetical protein AAB817_03200 [Patescibacteria group bacterium]